MPFDTDEHFRDGATIEDMAKLKPVFAKENGTVTAGNASGINDGAAAVVLMERSVAEKRGLKPMARLVAYAHAGVDPKYHGHRPGAGDAQGARTCGPEGLRPRCDRGQRGVRRAGLRGGQGPRASPPEKVNPNGSGISLGHPVGATGAIITIKALYELQRIGGRYALVTMCIGGGQGIAAIFERV